MSESYCPAYQKLEAVAREQFGAPLHSFEVLKVLEAFPDTVSELKKISDELNAGLGHDPETIGGRLDMPPDFVASLLFCIRKHHGIGFIQIPTVPLERRALN